MRNNKAVGATIALVVGLGLTGASLANGATTSTTTSEATRAAAAVVQPSANTVGTDQIKYQAVTAAKIAPKAVWGSMIMDNTIPLGKMGSDFRTQINRTISSANAATTAANAATTKANAADAKAQQALDAVNDLPQSPNYLKNWGEIFRNTIGNARAELGTSSSGEGLNFNVPTGADAVMWGNEADFAGKPFTLTAVGYEVFQTGENSATAGNMPSIKFEISNPATGATYTTLVYSPGNSASNTWTAIDAKADAGNHWGFTGTYFNTGTDRCGLNGSRCTLTEALSKLGDNAKFISAGVGKGRDNAWHGAIRSLTINGDTYKFTAGGVLKAQ